MQTNALLTPLAGSCTASPRSVETLNYAPSPRKNLSSPNNVCNRKVGRWGNTSWRCLCYALAAAYGSRAELADAILGRYRAATAKKLAKLPSYRISPAKSSGFIAMNDCDHEAKGQTHNRVSSHSAPKHVLFAVCHFAARGISVSTRAQERSGGRAYGDSLGKIPRELSWCHRSRGVLRDLIPFLTGSSRASNV